MEVWDRLNVVADAIEKDPDGFDQATYGGFPGSISTLVIPKNVGGVFPLAGSGECGSPACIAGWAIALFGDREGSADNVISATTIEHYAYELLNSGSHRAGHHLGRIFKTHWPQAWFREEERIELPRQRDYDVTMEVTPDDGEAVDFLRRLATQIKEEHDENQKDA